MNGGRISESWRTSVSGGGGTIVKLELEGAVYLLVDCVEVLGELSDAVWDMFRQGIEKVCSRV